LQAKKVKEFEEVYVATDDERIYSACVKRNIQCMMTSNCYKTGTDRVGEVAQKVSADIFVNIQGDEPLIEPETIREAVKPFIERRNSNIQVTNLMTRIYDPVDLINVTVPKVITSREGRGIYLTRSAAPFPKGKININYYKQVYAYGFIPEALQFFCQSPRGEIEFIEDIEILRFIEAGYYVQFMEVDSNTIAVDIPHDLERVMEYITKHSIPLEKPLKTHDKT